MPLTSLKRAMDENPVPLTSSKRVMDEIQCN